MEPRLGVPGQEGDYFSEEQVATWGLDQFWSLPEYRHTPYYRSSPCPWVPAEAWLDASLETRSRNGRRAHRMTDRYLSVDQVAERLGTTARFPRG